MKKALVLEGGSLRGLFSGGVIDVMMESGIEYDALIGVSAGAAFGCNYKSKQIGRPLRYNMRYAKDWRYCSVRSLLLTGDIFGAKFCYQTLPLKLDPMDKETYESNPMDMIVVCTDVHTGKPVYHKINELTPEALEWMRASASMPFVSRIVRVDGHAMLDGGISDSIPVQYAVEQGYDKVVVVTTQPEDYVKKPFGHDGIVRLALHKYPRLAQAILDRHRMYNREMAYLKEKEEEGRIYCIRPDEALDIKRIEHDAGKMETVYQVGRLKGEVIMDELKAYLGVPKTEA